MAVLEEERWWFSAAMDDWEFPFFLFCMLLARRRCGWISLVLICRDKYCVSFPNCRVFVRDMQCRAAALSLLHQSEIGVWRAPNHSYARWTLSAPPMAVAVYRGAYCTSSWALTCRGRVHRWECVEWWFRRPRGGERNQLGVVEGRRWQGREGKIGRLSVLSTSGSGDARPPI